MTIGAIGVVFGNIGTSPLFALGQIFYGPAQVAPTQANVFGCISLAIWTLTLIVGLKYAVLVLRADSDGEGGVFALYSLLHKYREKCPVLIVVLAALTLGAGFLIADSAITPAISVLSAVEGLKAAAPSLADSGVPVTLVILVMLFAAQRKGTRAAGRIFGPVVIAWFAVLAILGARQIHLQPDLACFEPGPRRRFPAQQRGT
ncbi:MAG: KUP/HAK/KT family potassium transporter [Rhodomicrobium sp.]